MRLRLLCSRRLPLLSAKGSNGSRAKRELAYEGANSAFRRDGLPCPPAVQDRRSQRVHRQVEPAVALGRHSADPREQVIGAERQRLFRGGRAGLDDRLTGGHQRGARRAAVFESAQPSLVGFDVKTDTSAIGGDYGLASGEGKARAPQRPIKQRGNAAHGLELAAAFRRDRRAARRC